MNSEILEQRRFTPVNPELVYAAILPRDPRVPGSIQAELREFSQQAVILLVTGPPELRYQCRVQLKSHRFRPVLLAPAEIHWARPNPAGDWLLGCNFDAPLDTVEFKEVIDSGVMNRRGSSRERSRIAVQVQLQPTKERIPTTISDFSEGGVCLAVSGAQGADCSRHVCVYGVVEGREVRIPLKTRWSLSVGPNRLIGCQYMRAADHDVVRQLHQASQQQPLYDVLRPGSKAMHEVR